MSETISPPHVLSVGDGAPDSLPDAQSGMTVVATVCADSLVPFLERRGAECLLVGPDVAPENWQSLLDAARSVDEHIPTVFLSDATGASAVSDTPNAEVLSPTDPGLVRRRLAALADDYRERRESAAARHLDALRETVADGEWSTPESLFESLCTELVDFEDYEFAWYGRAELQAGTLRSLAWAGSDSLRGATFDLSEIRAGWGPSGRAALTMDISVIHDIGGAEEFFPWLDDDPSAFGVHSVAAVPITASGAGVPFGQLAIYSNHPHAFTGRERSALESLSRAVADRLVSFGRERWQVGDGVGREHLTDLVAAFPDLAVVYDESGTYVDVLTPHQVRNFTTPEELVGRHASDVLPEEAATRVLDALDEAFDSNEVKRVEYPITVGDEPLWYEAKIAPVDLPDGRRLAVATIRETTERKSTERELTRQKERIERLTGILSHDLKNHLGKASGWAELARDTTDDELEELTRVSTVLSEMETLLNETVEIIRQSQRVLQTEPVDVADIASRCWKNLPERGDLHVDSGLTPIMADADRVRQLLENLFVNVIEHAGPTTTVRIGASGSGFYVEDDGPGIDEDERESVFEFGYTSSAGGSGFGLAIVQEIAEAHGWTVSVGESDDGGTRFEFGDVEWATVDPD